MDPLHHNGRFTASEIDLLLTHRSISPLQPWASNDGAQVDRFLRKVVDDICATTGALARIEWDHYGSGYASFVDAWFYLAAPDFAVERQAAGTEHHVGLVVLFSRLAPCFVLMQGEKLWSSRGGSSYMPSAQDVDRIDAVGPSRLAREVEPILERHGLMRLSREDLLAPLPEGTRVPTILGEEPFLEFDALFHWED